jgi:hypothetical protein
VRLFLGCGVAATDWRVLGSFADIIALCFPFPFFSIWVLIDFFRYISNFVEFSLHFWLLIDIMLINIKEN